MIKGNDEISLKFIANKKNNRKHYRQKHSKINRNRRWILSFRCENIKIIKRKNIKHEKYIETLTSILRKKKRIIRKQIDEKKMPIDDRKCQWIVSLRFENAEGKTKKGEKEKKGRKRDVKNT